MLDMTEPTSAFINPSCEPATLTVVGLDSTVSHTAQIGCPTRPSLMWAFHRQIAIRKFSTHLKDQSGKCGAKVRGTVLAPALKVYVLVMTRGT